MTECKGYTGRVLVESDAIVIVRDTFASKASHGGVAPWRIPLHAITDVYFQPATRLKNGKIQIVVGTVPPSNRDAAAADTVIFTHGQQESFAHLADWLREVGKVNAESGVDSSAVSMDPPPTLRGLGGHLQGAQAAMEAPREGRDVIFEGKSHDPGRNATVILYPDRIERIKERSAMSFSSAKQDAEVTAIRAVSSVQAKKEGFWTKVTAYASGNNIDFRFGHDEAHRFRDAITNLIVNQGQVAPATPAAAAPDVMDQLKKLGELRDAGVLTPEEFETKKAELLKRL
jgi:hypothetical protein